ncbi:transcriptional activator NhaR [Amphritea balenae]|uniref:Transcriptional activator NhaR n=1 Tax=Amphritea balenae TaxID=452629 RepID=A0A3P1SR85_9GAMM|nr:transcriptional activator NhaR [Amphritea balenae]RRC99155.1 transcriptional activator NhaR [Amphritea balenae]GGK73518.1 transcriptional activator NhaR [Amphritea balenae]
MNFKHLRYFMAVAQEGSINRACKKLHLTPQTISGQIKLLEQELGTPLFKKRGRNLKLTKAGQYALNYAEEIFLLGDELKQSIQDPTSLKQQRFNIGIADVLPKLITYRLLEPALKLADASRLICEEGPLPSLLADLATQKLDLVLADRPLDASFHIRGYNHLLGECGLSFFATTQDAPTYRTDFPHSLEGAPMLMPSAETERGTGLMRWFDRHKITPDIQVECADTALIEAFGLSGAGIFCAPTVIEQQMTQQYGVEVIGRMDDIRERFYAISLERRVSHPGVLAVCNTARRALFDEDNEEGNEED